MALGETAIHTSPPHHYERIRSLLHTRLSSFPVVLSLPYAFPVSPFYSCYYSHFFGVWIYCGRYLLFGLFVLDCFVILTGFISCLFSWLRMLTLGFTCAESPSHAQLIRAELSSNGSSEPPFGVDFQAELSSNPSLSEGPLQLKGCTRTSSLFSPTTPSGASVLCACS